MVTGFNFDFSCTDYHPYAQEVQFNSVYNGFVCGKLHSLPLLTSTLLSNYFDLKKAVTFHEVTTFLFYPINTHYGIFA